MASRYIDVMVEEHDEIPDGCELRFHAVGAGRAVHRVRYEPLTPAAVEGEYEVAALGADGREGPAEAVPVDDSGAGTSLLVHGGARGLRLRPVDGGGPAIAEPYLLLADEAVIE
jgi:hypothetical protein